MVALPQGPAGPLHGVPALPAEYLERGELGGLRTALLGAGTGAVGVTGEVPAVGLHGQGGIGKTVLAAAAACDPVVRAHFPDGVFWVTAGEQPDLVGLQTSLLSRLGAAGTAPRSATEGVGLAAAGAGRPAGAAGHRRRVVGGGRAGVPRHRAARPRPVYHPRPGGAGGRPRRRRTGRRAVSGSAARQLLASIAGVPAGALPDGEVARVLAATGRVALAVALVGAAVRSGASWPQVADELDRGGDTFLDHPYANTFKALQVATAALDPGLAFAYCSLAVYPPDIRIPVAAVARYWGSCAAAHPARCTPTCGRSPTASCSSWTGTRSPSTTCSTATCCCRRTTWRCCMPTCWPATGACLPPPGPAGGGCRPASPTSGIICCTTCTAPEIAPGPPAR